MASINIIYFSNQFIRQNFLTTSLSTILLSLLKPVGTVFSLSISVLSTAAFNLAKFDFNAWLYVSIPFFFFL